MNNLDLNNISDDEVKLLKAALARSRAVQNDFGAFDIHHPERSPNWPRYQHQDFPRMVYHPVKLDPVIEEQRRSIEKRNQRNPNMPALDLPHPQPLVKTVRSQEELDQAREEGFVLKPPFIVGAEGEDEPTRGNDPLADAVSDPAGEAEQRRGKARRSA